MAPLHAMIAENTSMTGDAQGGGDRYIGEMGVFARGRLRAGGVTWFPIQRQIREE